MAPISARKAPLRLVFPDFDPLGWSRGMRTSAAESVSIDTHVSQEGKGENLRVVPGGNRERSGDRREEAAGFLG